MKTFTVKGINVCDILKDLNKGDNTKNVLKLKICYFFVILIVKT